MMADEPIYDEQIYEQIYEQWIAHRQAAEPSRDLTDRVMATVEEQGVQCKPHVRLADRMNESRPARYAACLAASLVGSLPFFLVAYVAKFLAF